ncbi:hypothetical protein HK105_208072 [Polyrhizophydium stewartii]|uniref:Uncharacterized protein n=1 Tax=Polyrhizophydium stewartii TaxID=2732419 RepID=A0ABR4MYS5_9FUNG|nr:hypothetical protein HK105_002688 [Polyrhizophydium stewartii]
MPDRLLPPSLAKPFDPSEMVLSLHERLHPYFIIDIDRAALPADVAAIPDLKVAMLLTQEQIETVKTACLNQLIAKSSRLTDGFSLAYQRRYPYRDLILTKLGLLGSRGPLAVFSATNVAAAVQTAAGKSPLLSAAASSTSHASASAAAPAAGGAQSAVSGSSSRLTLGAGSLTWDFRHLDRKSVQIHSYALFPLIKPPPAQRRSTGNSGTRRYSNDTFGLRNSLVGGYADTDDGEHSDSTTYAEHRMSISTTDYDTDVTDDGARGGAASAASAAASGIIKQVDRRPSRAARTQQSARTAGATASNSGSAAISTLIRARESFSVCWWEAHIFHVSQRVGTSPQIRQLAAATPPGAAAVAAFAAGASMAAGAGAKGKSAAAGSVGAGLRRLHTDAASARASSTRGGDHDAPASSSSSSSAAAAAAAAASGSGSGSASASPPELLTVRAQLGDGSTLDVRLVVRTWIRRTWQVEFCNQPPPAPPSPGQEYDEYEGEESEY